MKNLSKILLLASLISFIKFSSATPFDLISLESMFGGRIGVYAIDTNSGNIYSHRADERFPLCSSFKGFMAAAILSKSLYSDGFLNQHVQYSERVLEAHSPVTQKNIITGMTIAELAAAAVQYSDNGATNLLLEKYLGGPEGLTSFMRSIGDDTFRLDRWELELNSAIPGDRRDTSSPKAVVTSLKKLTLGNLLESTQREILIGWLVGNTTGDNRIRSVLPSDWVVGDKTGTCGAYGAANDYAVIWPRDRKPIIIAVYTSSAKKNAKYSDFIIASAARVALTNLQMD